MAILKHIAGKNADYGGAQRYLIFQHDKYTEKPILDENGKCCFGKNIIWTAWVCATENASIRLTCSLLPNEK